MRGIPGLRVLASIAAIGLGCSNSGVPDYPLLTDQCDPDAGYCRPLGAGGMSATTASSSASSNSSSSAGTGGAVSTSELKGTIDKITSPDFSDTASAFSGAATVKVYPAVGSEIDVPFAGTPPTFDAKNVAAGKAWFFVQDQSMGASGIWSTVSSVTVPQISSVVLPVIDAALVTSIASTLPAVQAKGVSQKSAHVVLLLQHGGAPYKGVQVSSGGGGAIVAYDIGQGLYSDAATSTGAAGTVILFDTSLSGLASITITDTALAKSWPVSVLTGAGAFTLATFDLE